MKISMEKRNASPTPKFNQCDFSKSMSASKYVADMDCDNLLTLT